MRSFLRREEASFTSQNSDVDVISGCNLAHKSREAVVEILSHGIELLLEIDGDDGNLAGDVESNRVF